ncbi:unnamed protein product, partial [Scytosiphon promiscuus]
MEKIDSIEEGNAVNVNHAGNASAIHKINGWDVSEQEDRAKIRQAEIEERRKEVEAVNLARDRIKRLSTKDRAATIGDLMAFADGGDPEDEPKCVECKQHFDDDNGKISCDTCDDSWHRGCVEPTPSDSSDDGETWCCSRCDHARDAPFEECGNGDEGDGGSAPGGVEGDGDSGGGGGAARTARKRSSRSRHAALVQTEDAADGDTVAENIRNEKDAATKVKENRPYVDSRNLTLKLLVEGVRTVVGGGYISEDTLRLFEKDDCRLYGIVVRDLSRRDDGETVDGTVVSIGGRSWTVVGESRDGDGYKLFKLRSADKSRKKKGTTRHSTTFEIRQHLVDPNVVSLEDERERVSLVLCVILCLAYVHVYKFIKDDPKIKRQKKVVALSADEHEGVLSMRKSAWDRIRSANTKDVINAHETALLHWDGDLKGEFEKDESLFGFLGLESFEAIGFQSLVDQPREFAEDHLPTVSHYIRGAQSAYKLGRPVSWESCMAPLSAGGCHTELPPGVDLNHDEVATIPFYCTTDEAREAGFSLAIRALLARARDTGGICKWYQHVPLYRLIQFSRPGKDMKPTSENSSRVSPTRKHIVAFKEASVCNSNALEKNIRVMECFYEGYEPVAKQKKKIAELWENRRQRMGFGPKKKNGRVHEPGSKEANELILFMRKLMKKNGIDPIMKELDQEDLDVCYRVLEGDEDLIGERKDEAHLYP